MSASVIPDDGEGYSIWGGASADSGIYSLSKSYLVKVGMPYFEISFDHTNVGF